MEEARARLLKFFRTRNMYHFRGKLLFQKGKRGTWAKRTTDRQRPESAAPNRED